VKSEPVPLFANTRARPAVTESGTHLVFRRLHYVLGNGCHTTDDCGLRGVSHVLPALLRLLAGNKNQPAIKHLAPSADVMIAELHKKDRPIMITVPTKGGDFLLARIDAHERSWHSSDLPVKSKATGKDEDGEHIQSGLLQFLPEEN
jgi:hypothetical protein